MSAARVVTLYVPLTPPIVRVAFAVVEKSAADVTRTATESPLLTVPAADVKAPLLMEY
jgi:hypothetical protein